MEMPQVQELQEVHEEDRHLEDASYTYNSPEEIRVQREKDWQDKGKSQFPLKEPKLDSICVKAIERQTYLRFVCSGCKA